MEFITNPLSFLIILPIVTGLVLLAVPPEKDNIIKDLALAGALWTFIVSLTLYRGFDPAQTAMQFQFTRPWLPSFGINYFLGIDGIGLLMIAALGLIVGGIWWFTNRATGGGPEADGSLIAAPAQPYRVRPEDEGGKTFAGTGDTSFAVGEGQTREGRLATAPPEPEADATDEAPSEPAPARSGALPAGTAVQVGAYSSRADAETGWSTLIRQTEVLSGVDYRIVEGRADIGTVFRLQAAAGDAANARRMCQALKGDGLPCTVK